MSKSMSFKEISEIQHDFDAKHGFYIDKTTTRDKYNQISKDLIGLYGEVGEFSNIVKKVNLLLDKEQDGDITDLELREDALREELVDTFVYFVRLAKALSLDLEIEYLKKLNKNTEKYSSYER